MKIVVQKFGGTSLDTPEKQRAAIHHVKRAKDAGYEVVIVVSAMGRRGSPYATDTLLSLVDKELISQRDVDFLLSCGETISAVKFVSMLQKHGYQSIALNGAQAGITTDSRHGNAAVLDVNATRIQSALEAGCVPVVTGFQGVTVKGDTTTLGRGGSDITAVVLGAALGAESVDIFTDVEGVLSADPRIVSSARLLPHLSYSEMYSLACNGANVLHPRSVHFAELHQVLIHVRKTLATQPGTFIGKAPTRLSSGNRLKGIACMANMLKIEKNSPLTERQWEILRGAKDVQIDSITTDDGKLSFTVRYGDKPQTINLLEKLGVSDSEIMDCAQITIVGDIHDEAVMSRMQMGSVDTLKQRGIDVLASNTSGKISWYLVAETHMEEAAVALHDDLSLHQDCGQEETDDMVLSI